MTLDEALANAERELDALIARYVWELDLKLRLDCLVTGPESEAELDKPADPASPWQRTTPEEIVLAERERLAAWKAEQLALIRRELGLGPMQAVVARST